jgi:tetratricopeptide (TPR) repeat protein
VAIKEVLGSDVAAEARFAREALVTATLQHPAIVPVYEVGRWPSGRPFYAMKLVAGRSLDKIVADTAGMDDRLRLVPHVLAAAEALAYAHSLGVIHRDLKPDNVLVGAFGETVVIDWGLAKLRGVGDLEHGLAEGSVSGSSDFATEIGAALGTPPYMPPEQARGQPADERADVYGLGALLYHVLSGRPAYAGGSAKEVIAQVLAGPPPALESRAPELPPDLVAIVRKAMMPDSAERYPSGKEMAEDLRRYTTGQLVSAHFYSTAALARRWLRRNRVVVTVAGVLVALLCALAIVAAARIVRERDRAQAERLIATAHRGAAEQLVEFLVESFRDRVREADRLDLLAGLGDKIAAYYSQLDASGLAPDPRSLGRRAGALETLAVVEQNKKNAASARALNQQAIGLRERAAAAAPPRAGELVSRGKSWQRMGVIENEQGHIEAALASYGRAVALADGAERADPGSIDAALLAATSQEGISRTLHYRKGDMAGAYEVLTGARERIAVVLAAHPGDARLERKLASLHNHLHQLELYLGRLDDAVRSIGKAVELYASVVRRAPDDAELARAYAGVYFGLSDVELARGNLREAAAAMRLHLDRYEEIARADRDNRATQRDLGWSYAQSCAIERRARRLAAASDACARSARIFREHLGHDPGSLESKDALVNSLVHQSRLERAAEQAAAAGRSAREAVALARGLVASDASAGRWREDLMLALGDLARAEMDQGLARDAGPHAREALALAEGLIADGGDTVDARSGMAELRALVGRSEAALGRAAEAIALFESAIAALEQVAARSPGVVYYQVNLAAALAELARALGAREQRARAGELRARALSILDRLRAAGHLYPEDEELRAALLAPSPPVRRRAR